MTHRRFVPPELVNRHLPPVLVRGEQPWGGRVFVYEDVDAPDDPERHRRVLLGGVPQPGTWSCPDGTACSTSQVSKCSGCAAVPPYGMYCSCECGTLTADPFPD